MKKAHETKLTKKNPMDMIKRLILSLICIGSLTALSAQTVYPIRSYTILTPPMPYSLSSFAGETGKMQLNINVDDITLENYPVKFRLFITGNGIRLYTKPNMIQDPYFLFGGMTETLTGMDLAPLFDPNNLIFEGFSKSQYELEGRLPEGVYQIKVEVWDYHHNINISQAIPGVAVMYLTRAPQLTLPFDNSELDILNNLNIRFSWMGFVPNDPLSDIVYEFKLWEILPDGRSKYEIVNSLAPIYKQQTNAAYLVYDMGMPPLQTGRSYAWQVQALDLDNKARFQNNGYSDVFLFRYGASCPNPTIKIKEISNTHATFNISMSKGANLYSIFYKTEDTEEWQSTETDNRNYTLTGLNENTTYQVKVVSLCGDEESDESSIITFKTKWNIDYTCGTNLAGVDLSNTEPLHDLKRFGLFKAADFTIEVVEVSGNNGRFSGSGFALIPYLGFIKFGVDFENVFINRDRRMTEGEVKFQYNEDTGLMLDLGSVLSALNSSDNSETIDQSESIDETTDYVIKVDDEIIDVTIDGNTVTVITIGGKEQTYTANPGETVGIISPASDNTYVADTGTGQVYTTPNNSNHNNNKIVSPAQSGEYGVTATFSPAVNMRYGYDAVGTRGNKTNGYFQTDKQGNRIDWKSLGNGRSDYFDVSIHGADPDSVRYLRSSGMIASSTNLDDKKQIRLTGITGGEEETLTAAFVKTKQINDSTQNEILTEAGAIGIINYDYILKSVHLIPINNSNCPDNAASVKDLLNKYYAPAIVEWDVRIENALEIDDINYKDLATEGKTMLSKYTSEMNSIIDLYASTRSIDNEHLFIFFIDNQQIQTNAFMPISGHYGFVFNFNNSIENIAHALGHGTFNLWHTYSPNSSYNLSKNTTNNLMDNLGGTELWKYQWDLIHNPETVIEGFMVDDIGYSESLSNTSSDSSSIKFTKGPITISFPQDFSGVNDNLVHKSFANVEIKINDKEVQETINSNLEVSYKINSEGIFTFINISKDGLNKIFPDLFSIGSTAQSVEFTFDNSTGTPISKGAIDFSLDLSNDKSFKNGFIILRKGIDGKFTYQFESKNGEYSSSFDFSNVENINIDLVKDSKVLASLTNGSLESSGILKSEVNLEQPITYKNNGFNISLTTFSTDLEYDFRNNHFKYNTLSGDASVKEIPGISAQLDLSLNKKEDEFIAEINNVNDINIYGLSVQAKSLIAQFDENFDLEVFSIKNATAKFSQSGASGQVSIKSLVVENNKIKSLAGSGALAYDSIAGISLTNASYNSATKQMIFSANIKTEDGSAANANVSIDQVKINEDGSIELGEISGDMKFVGGPVTVEFSAKPDNNTRGKTKTVNARVALEASEGDFTETIVYETTATYISDKNLGIIYLNLDAKELDIEFPELYGISTTVKSIHFEYTKHEDDNKTYEGSITLSANLSKDKPIYQNLVILEKGVSGNIIFSYQQNEDSVSGSFDFTNIKGLKLSYIKDDKKLATLGGSLDKKATLSGKFVLNKGVEFSNSGFTMMLNSFDVNAQYNLKTEEFIFDGGKGSAKLYNIQGINGQINVDFDYTPDNFSASIGSNSELSICGMHVENMDLDVTSDEFWNISKIGGSFTLKHSSINSSIEVKKVSIENGSLVSFKGNSNINYKGFDFKLADITYNQSSFACDASVLIDKNGSGGYFAVDDFKIDSIGSITVGGIEGDLNRSVMAIHFAATFKENDFKGEFNATLSKKIGMSGEVHMGSGECGTFPCSGRYPFGYYALKVGAPIPIFPGIKITNLGGRFGYNYKYDFSNLKDIKGQPSYGTYLAGLSLGVSDASNSIKLEVDPALMQWGNEETSIYLEGGLKIPSSNPMIEASAQVQLHLPSYDLKGRFAADVNIPSSDLPLVSKGFVFNSSGELNFVQNETEQSFSGQLNNATLLKSLSFSGSFVNKRLYDSNGNETSFLGNLNGQMTYTSGFAFDTKGPGYSIDANFNLLFSANCKVDYSPIGLNDGHFDGRITSSGNINATIIGCSISPSFSLDADANLDYINPNWLLQSQLLIKYKIDEDSNEKSITKHFEYEF